LRFAPDEAFAILERTPEVLDNMLRGTSATLHKANEGRDTWSAFDVVGHLIHAEETNWIPRARSILEHGEARAFDPLIASLSLPGLETGRWTISSTASARFAART
jgi:hypothetical protein